MDLYERIIELSSIIQQPFRSCSSQSPQLSGQDFSLILGFTGVSVDRFSLPQERYSAAVPSQISV